MDIPERKTVPFFLLAIRIRSGNKKKRRWSKEETECERRKKERNCTYIELNILFQLPNPIPLPLYLFDSVLKWALSRWARAWWVRVRVRGGEERGELLSFSMLLLFVFLCLWYCIFCRAALVMGNLQITPLIRGVWKSVIWCTISSCRKIIPSLLLCDFKIVWSGFVWVEWNVCACEVVMCVNVMVGCDGVHLAKRRNYARRQVTKQTNISITSILILK